LATIEERGPYQFRVKIRRKGVTQTKTFETWAEADRWARIVEGKVVGDEFVDRRAAQQTTVSQACAWMMDRVAPADEETGKRVPRSDHAKNQVSKLRYWMSSEFADWALVSLKPWELIEWREELLDDGAASPQTIVHRLNTLSLVYKEWPLAHKVPVDNPVIEGVRPSLGPGRNRRLNAEPDEHGKTEEQRLLDACAKSSRPWLRAAVIISIETCMRQAELAGLTWGRVHLDAKFPYADLYRTKNNRPRRVPLSKRAVEAFRSLLPEGVTPMPMKPVFPVETPRAIGHAWHDAVDEKAFPDLRWHDLRHEAISRLFEHTDLREHEIMAISGHLGHDMLTRYTHLRADRLGARLPGSNLPEAQGTQS